MNHPESKTDLYNLVDKANDTTLQNTIIEILSKQANNLDFWDDLLLSV